MFTTAQTIFVQVALLAKDSALSSVSSRAVDKLQRAGRDFLMRLVAMHGPRGGGAGAAGVSG